MNGQAKNTEERVEAYFAHQRERIHAPLGFAQRIDAAIEASPRGSTRRRWPAIVATVAAAAAVAAVLLYIVGDFGGGPGQRSAADVLADASDVLGDPSSIGLNSYSGTAQMTVRGFKAGGFDIGPERVVTRVWYEAPDGYRVESEVREPDGEIERDVFVGNGDFFWHFDVEDNTYERVSVERLASDLAYGLIVPGAQMGSNNVDRLLEAASEDAPGVITLEGEEVLLDRPVYVIQFTPHDPGVRELEDGSTENWLPVRIWIDKEFLFILRLELSADAELGFEGLELSYTDVEFNSDLPDELFVFTPPAGTVEIDSEEESFDQGEIEVAPVETPVP